MQRSKGRNAVAAAAYRSCTLLNDEQLGKVYDYRPKAGHVCTELFGVAGLEIGMDDIGTLWNSAERSETRKNSAVARELMVPLPHEWTDEQRRLCVRGLSEMLVARYGVAVMASIHRPANGQNNHVHILFTTREVDAQMNFGKKTRILDDMKTGEVKNMREEVCRVMNEHAKANGADWYVYAGKFAEVEEWHIPTAHIPVNAPSELREAMEAENLAIVEARPLLKRIMEESKETAAQVEAALQVAAIAATQEHQIVKAEAPQKRPSLLPPVPSANPLAEDAQQRISQLNNSLEIQHAYREVLRTHVKRKEGREVAKKWKEHLRTLEADPPGPLVSIMSKLARALGVRDILAIYEEKVAKARANIEQCRKSDAVLTAYIEDPERRRKYEEWKHWPEHRERVMAYEATLPDAPRQSPAPGPEYHSVAPSSTCDGPFTLTPHQTPKIPEPWEW
ncbi:MobA/MobL family protein [Comamonas sp. CMM01]|uniref:MobA/MobL family protein n=1 Tax=Comamonas sp. CMM01 TaxID=2769280 RepID=UPI00177DF04D|nr:MobA/MobL family protein [Comamonas sp. CMM01]MBD9530661.1 MobA/MobL family protein [Comamonas sp. CMM01]